MTTADDQARSGGAPRRILSSLRDVLFENTSRSPAEVSADGTLARVASAADVEAARSVLRASVEAQLGPGVREFLLQNEALSEALPDPPARRRAALRVLSLKGTSREQLCSEIERALSALVTQGQAFARKLHDRREALQVNQGHVSERCVQETAEAEQCIARLEAELAAQRQAIAESQTRRDQDLGACEQKLAELGAREVGFRCAFREVESEFRALEAQLLQERV